jgi:hypothetical protein
MGTRIKLRFDGLLHFETSPLFCTLEPSTEAAFRRLPSTYERSVAALSYFRRIRGDIDALGVSEEHRRIMQVAYLQAALMEYVANEEVLPVVCNTGLCGCGGAALRFSCDLTFNHRTCSPFVS